MEHAQTLQGGRTWYLIASGGDIAMRVRSGMPLGENRAGDLSFDPVHAQLELEIEPDGGLIVRVIGTALAFADDSQQGIERVARDGRAEIHLPHNILRLDTDFNAPPQADNTLQIRTVPVVRESAPELPPQQPIVAERSAPRDFEPTRAPLWPRVRKLAPLLALASVALLILVSALWNSPEPEAVVAQEAVVASSPQRQPQQSATKPAQPPASETAQTELFRPDPEVQRDAPSTSTSPSPMPVAQSEGVSQPVQQGAIPETVDNAEISRVERERPDLTAAQPGPTRSPRSSATAAPEATTPRPTAVSRPSRTAQQNQEYDLLAASLALEEDRLMMPSETSAYALFSKVLKTNPDSAQAKLGLQTVRERLVNRAFAQLASKAWGEARATLAAAAEAGVNPALVADLSGEVDYGQRLADAQAGRFATQYPGEQLVAIDRPLPRLRRLRAGESGSVEVQFTVTQLGSVSDVEVLGNPSARVEREIRRVMERWRFEPVLYKGRPLPVQTRLWLAVGR